MIFIQKDRQSSKDKWRQEKTSWRSTTVNCYDEPGTGVYTCFFLLHKYFFYLSFCVGQICVYGKGENLGGCDGAETWIWQIVS